MSKTRKSYKLEEVAEVFTGFPFKGDKYHNAEGTKVVRGENVTIGNLRWDTVKYWNEEFDEFEKYALEEGDIVIGMDGSRVGKNRAQIKANDLPLLLAQRVARIRAKKNFDQDFLAHIIKSDEFENYVKAVHTGTSIPHISGTQLKEFEFKATSDLKEQKQIASILSSLDNKIELNLQMNQTLEEMAQAIFKEWFVNFNFPDQQRKGANGLPKGWKIDTFKNQFNVERGLSYKGSGLAESGEGIPMHNLNSVYEGGGYKYEGIKYYSGEYRERHLVNPREIIVANTEQGHKHLLIGFPAVTPFHFGTKTIFSHHIYRVRPNENSYLTPQFIYYLIVQPEIREQIIGCTNGTTVNMLKIDGLQLPEFNLPTKDLVTKFSGLIEGIWQRKEANYQENQTLIQLRDNLLPRLMTGQIEVKA